MKVSKRAVAIAAAVMLAGTSAPRLWAFQTPTNGVQAINADFVPTSEQVQAELTELNERLETGRKASFYSSEASSEYLEAQRYYEYGRFDEALAHARAGESVLPNIPNWPESASR
jgi:hypothetical protein